ncbi:MAG: chemotaxis protein CheB [Bacteroidota bacterium]|nr:chemotaxis protein CheB [Bacteroidota bacterium]
MKFKAIVIGVSSGGITALKTLLPALPATFGIPVIIVQHLAFNSGDYWIEHLNEACEINIKEADEKEKIEKGMVYIAPPNYHLLIETDQTFSLSIDEKVNHARPSIDVLFESAAETFNQHLIGIVLTGLNNDGALGLKKIKEYGGTTIVQDPSTAESDIMPLSAIALSPVDYILPLNKISDLLIQLEHQL